MSANRTLAHGHEPRGPRALWAAGADNRRALRLEVARKVAHFVASSPKERATPREPEGASRSRASAREAARSITPEHRGVARSVDI